MTFPISVLGPTSQSCSYLWKKNIGPKDSRGCMGKQGIFTTNSDQNFTVVSDNYFDKYIWKWYLLPIWVNTLLFSEYVQQQKITWSLLSPCVMSHSQLLKLNLMMASKAFPQTGWIICLGLPSSLMLVLGLEDGPWAAGPYALIYYISKHYL